MATPDTPDAPTVHQLDAVVIGAGISGINAAYRLQSELPPSFRFTVLEARDDIGGTWSLFKYPGIRSDSDLHTFGFAWHPWPHAHPIAEGPLIMSYLREAVAAHGLERHMRFRQRVTAARWSSKTRKWTVDVTDGAGRKVQYVASFVVFGTGYYDYDKPLEPQIPGLDRFAGRVIHPQFWPADFDHSNKNIVIVGSGATAVTLLPALASKAAHVTMLQRSPGYIIARNNSPGPAWARRLFPRAFVQAYERFFFLIFPALFWNLCQWFPRRMRAVLLRETRRRLPPHVPLEPHFTPSYNPWEQRLCLAPDGDFYQALHDKDRVSVVTGRIRAVTERSIELEGGDSNGDAKEGQEPVRRLDNVDVIITATGLRMQFAGGLPLFVDGERVRVPDKALWNGTMLSDVPNLFYLLGYANASWTLGADQNALLLCRLVRRLRARGLGVVVPRAPDFASLPPPKGKTGAPALLPLKSNYVALAQDQMPKCWWERPWLPRGYMLSDLAFAWWGDETKGLEFGV